MWPTEKRRRALLRELADADRVNARAGHAGRCMPEQGGAGRTGPRRADGRTAMPRQRRSGDTHPARAERRAWAALKAQVHAPLLQWGMRVGIGAEHTDCQAVLSDLERVRPRGTAEPVGLVHDRRARHAGIMERDYLGSTVESPFGADMSDHAPVHALWDAECPGAHTRATFRTVGGRRLFFDGVGWRGVCPQATDTARRAARLQRCAEEPHGTGREGVTLEAAERRGGRQTRTSPSAWHKTAHAAISYQGLPKAKAGAHRGSCGRPAAEQEKPEAPGRDWEQGTGLDWRTDWTGETDVHAARCEDFALERFDALDLEADAVAHGLTTPRAGTPLRIFVP
jgi:hypothetical protein